MDLSKQEKHLCKELKTRTSQLKVVDELEREDYNMVRFLRACNLDIEKAEVMFRKYISWCEENDLYNAHTWHIAAVLKNNFPYRVSGLSKTGGLVVCASVGDINPDLIQAKSDELLKFAFHELHALAKIQRYFCMQTNSFSKLVAVINLNGLTVAHISKKECIKAALTLLKGYEAHVPETLNTVYILSAPRSFSFLYSFYKRFISTKTHEKLRIMGSNKEIWRAEISKLVEEDQLPESLGGSLPEHSKLVLDADGIVRRKCDP